MRGAARLRLPSPTQPRHRDALQELADEGVREGGSAWLMAIAPANAADADAYPQLFDRSADYAALVKPGGKQPHFVFARRRRTDASAEEAASRL